MHQTTERQAEIHKSEVIWGMLKSRGLEQGHKLQTIRHVATWHTTRDLSQIPKIWQDKAEDIFNELVPPEKLQAVVNAAELYINGDDSALRQLVPRRVSVEIGTKISNSNYGSAPVWRSRKFSDPLFVTPAGFLNAYPEMDEDLFIDNVQAQQALVFYRGMPNKFSLENASYQIIEPAVLGKIGGDGYKRWQAEVKGQHYTEPRRSLAQAHALYQEHGRVQLEKEYSPSYVFALIRKFNTEGLAVLKEDLDRIVHPYGFAFYQKQR